MPRNIGGFSFLNPAIRAPYFSLAAERINIAVPHRQEHDRNNQPRHRVSHRRSTVTQAEAEDICDIAQALAAHCVKRWTERTDRRHPRERR